MRTQSKLDGGNHGMPMTTRTALIGCLVLGVLIVPPSGWIAAAAGDADAGTFGRGQLSEDVAIVGIPWTGEVGITESVADIAWRDSLLIPDEEIRLSGDRMEEYPDRSGLPMDPNSLDVSSWPPRDPDSDDARADSRALPYTVGASFLGASISAAIPPDSMGAVGLTQYLVTVNDKVKVFNKSGGSGALNTSLNNFFDSVRGGSGTSDPRVVFDRLEERWFVICITVSEPNRVLIAVSDGPEITETSDFTFYYFQQDLITPTSSTDTGGLFDYPSLGLDSNALYIGGNMFNPWFRGSTAFVVRKSSVTGGGPIVATAFRQICTSTGSGCFSPQGVYNDDVPATYGYFIGVSGNTTGRLVLRRVSDPGGSPSISGNINLSVPSTRNPEYVPCEGSTHDLDSVDDRLMAAKNHRNQLTGESTLWTCHHIEVNDAGVASSSGNRNGTRWYQISDLDGTPTLAQSGTVFDTNNSWPTSFWMGDVAMSGQGRMILGCSASSTNRYADVVVAGRLHDDPAGDTSRSTVVNAAHTYNIQSVTPQRWGDYSYTCVDPSDDMTIWTAQEYCDNTNSWGVRVIELKAPPPVTPASCNPSIVKQGDSNVDLVVTGTSIDGSSFFDTDASFPQHLWGGASGTGVTTNSVTWTSSTEVTINVSVSQSAEAGARDITVKNPDRQSRLSSGGLLTVRATGDLNCDGVVDNFDIDPFVLALTATPPSYSEYYDEYPDCDRMLADCNYDGVVDNFDIDPFVALLT